VRLEKKLLCSIRYQFPDGATRKANCTMPSPAGKIIEEESWEEMFERRFPCLAVCLAGCGTLEGGEGSCGVSWAAGVPVPAFCYSGAGCHGPVCVT
jgi:hypothetical protein